MNLKQYSFKKTGTGAAVSMPKRNGTATSKNGPHAACKLIT